MYMRPFPSWTEALEVYRRYTKLTPEQKLVVEETGEFPEGGEGSKKKEEVKEGKNTKESNTSEPWYKVDDNTAYDYTPSSPLEGEEYLKQFDDYLNGLEMSKGTLEHAKDITDKISKLIQKKFNGKLELNLSGSIYTNLALEGSDLDLNLTLPNSEPSFDEVEDYFNQIKPLLDDIGVKNFYTIHRPKGRIPLIKFIETNQDLHVDISIGNFTCIPKTELLLAYVNLNPVIRNLLLFVKGWTKVREINLSNNGTLTTLCHSTMLLCFLVAIGSVPNLQRICKNHTNFKPNIQYPPKTSKQYLFTNTTGLSCELCQSPLPKSTDSPTRDYFTSNIRIDDKLDFDLLLGYYLEFMGFKFNPEHDAFSLYSGGFVSRSSLELPLPSKDHVKCSISTHSDDSIPTGEKIGINEVKLFMVEDPIEPKINMAASGRPWSLDGILWEFRRASHLHNSKQSLPQALLKPFTPPPSSLFYIKSGVYTKYQLLI